MKHSLEELRQWQALPLSIKIRMTQTRIRMWVNEYGESGAYISFSGGKDSTVLVDIVTKMGYMDIPLVFVDTGLEYPEIREFVKSYGDRVTWLRPKMNFRQVIDKYGYPFISKEVSECVYGARKYLTSLIDSVAVTDRQTDRQTDRICILTENLPALANMLNERMLGRKGGANQRLAIMLGMLSKDQTIKANIPKKDRSSFSQEKYKFFLYAPFEISNKCCTVMKKEPTKRYSRETGRKPITAQMACESRLRTQKWLQNGCNGFNMKSPTSNPMSFWTEQDVLLYIKENGLPICSVYGDIVESLEGTEEVEGQLTMSDIPGWEDQTEFDAERRPLKTTGCSRTGCMFCGFGCHLEKGEGRFERMKRTHPKQYDYIMRSREEGGLNYKEIIDWINEYGHFNIKY